MEKKKLVKKKHYSKNDPDLWMLPSTDSIRDSKYYHELAKGELYALFGNRCNDWFAELAINDLRPDCTMVYNGVPVHFEVDLGNEKFEVLEAKIQKYIHYAPHTDKTVFVLGDGQKRTVKGTGRELYSYLKEMRRGWQFSWTPLNLFTTLPDVPLIFLPTQPDPITIDQLCAE